MRLACALLAAAALASTAAAAPTALRYEGVGGKTLPSFRLSRPGTLRWQTSGGFLGGLFALKLLNHRADVMNPQLAFSRARSGTVPLAPGLYRLRVDALPGTTWQITVG
jgi:hypothetical protein